MRIVLVHRYFAPDTPPYAHILREIALRLGSAGHQVVVLTCKPSYNRSIISDAPSRETIAPGVEVRRWPVLNDRKSPILKVVNLAWFCLRLALVRRKLGKVDVMMAATTPPVAVAKLVGWLARRSGARFIYHKQDIYPEVVTAPGIMQARYWASALRWLDARTEHAADRIVVLSQDMASTIVARDNDSHVISVINNFDPWVLGRAIEAAGARDPRQRTDSLIVAYAGNLGRFQNLETVFAAAELVRDDPIEFHFFGSGALTTQLAARIRDRGLNHVHLDGHRPPAEVASFLHDRADLGIVSLMPGVIRAAYPSKTMSYLRHGCPILALIEADSDLATTIVGSRAGFQADPSDASEVARILREVAADRVALARAGSNAAELYKREFSPDRQLTRWVDLFETVGVELA